MTRTREEVLNEFGSAQCVKGDDCTDFDCVALNRMADAILTRDARIAALEAEVARVTANQQPGEPVAWMAGFTNGEMSHVIWNERSAREWAAQSETQVVLPMKWSDDPDADLVVMDIPHPRPRVGVTEAMVLAAFVRLYPGCEPDEMQHYHAADIRSALTAALALADSPAPPANGGGEVPEVGFGNPSGTAGVGVSEDMLEEAWKELRFQGIPDGPTLVDCIDRENLRSALTTALATGTRAGGDDA